MFKIKNKEFEIKYAYLDAFVDEQLVFGLQICADDNNLFDENDLYFNSEILLKIKPKEIKKWQDIAGKTIKWSDYPEDEKEPHALLYVFEHEEVTNAKIEFSNIDGKIFVKIEALCDINYDDDFSDNLLLEIETEVDFYGISCGKDTTEEDCKNEIQPYLDMNNLKYVKNKHGISIMVPKETDMQKNMLVLGNY